MGIDAKHIDRLLPRHPSAMNLDLSWDVRTDRRGFFKQHREELSTAASIRDISLEGALVEVIHTIVHDIADKVAVRFRGLDGEAVIRHCRPSSEGKVLYGVRFVRNPLFKDAIDAAVGELRGDKSALSTAWQRRN